MTRAWLSTLFELAGLYNAPARARMWLAHRCCLICDNRAGREALCAGCIADLPRRAELKLARRIANVTAAYAPFHYTFPVSQLIKAGKFAGNFGALDALAMRLASELASQLEGIDNVVPVPLAPMRYAMRGFNQAVELARPLAMALERPVRADWVRRNASRTAQSHLGAAARRDNVYAAFSVRAKVSGQSILVVDDVITTGATVAAVAAALRRAGAAQVIAVAVAATPLHASDHVSRLVTVRA